MEAYFWRVTLKKPYVILIGSASGTGKTTIASELAKELEIKHLIETDFIREIIRGIIGPEYVPALHKSSYDAYTTIREKHRFKNNHYGLVCAGFEEHVAHVIPGIEKVIERAIEDHDDVIIEGVHLVPGLLDIERFREDASIHFFVLTADEDAHKERFVERAMEIKRGGRHLEYFKENRMIHDYMDQQAKQHDVPTIKNQTIDGTVKSMLTLIRSICWRLISTHTVDELCEEINIILKYGGRMVDASYHLPGFKEPLKRRVDVYDPDKAKRFVKFLKKHPKEKKRLEELYKLSENVHNHMICAPDEKSLKKMLEELKEKGLTLKEEKPE